MITFNAYFLLKIIIIDVMKHMINLDKNAFILKQL
jgi:hypothetical protein